MVHASLQMAQAALFRLNLIILLHIDAQQEQLVR